MKNKIVIIIIAIIALFIFTQHEPKKEAGAPDFRNFYAVAWTGSACDNLAYARSMGYDYVMWQDGMQNCPASPTQPIYYYIESPDTKSVKGLKYWEIENLAGFTPLPENPINYDPVMRDEINNYFVWRYAQSSDPNIPWYDHLATGWFYGNGFRPYPDFQRQSIIDETVADDLALATKYNNPSKGLLFGGYSWDVPELPGEFWTARQDGSAGCAPGTCANPAGCPPCGGSQVTLAYWNIQVPPINSGYNHLQAPYDYQTYEEARAAYMKKLFEATKAQYSNMKILYEPYHVYSNWIQQVEGRADKSQLMPANDVIVCQESGDSVSDDIRFLTQTEIYASGLIDKSHICSTTPDTHDATRNLVIAGSAAQAGAWFNWFGRIGGTGGTSNTDITQTPDRLKLIRAIPGWDNLNGVALQDRTWDATNKIYTSTLSYADQNVMYSKHPKNGYVYAVILNSNGKVMLKTGEYVQNIYSTNALMQQASIATSEFNINGNEITLKDAANYGKAYIIELTSTQPPTTTTTTIAATTTTLSSDTTVATTTIQPTTSVSTTTTLSNATCSWYEAQEGQKCVYDSKVITIVVLVVGLVGLFFYQQNKAVPIIKKK